MHMSRSMLHASASQWAQSMGVAMMANKKTLFVTFVDRASLSLISTDWLR